MLKPALHRPQQTIAGSGPPNRIAQLLAPQPHRSPSSASSGTG
jgi:hypothetical protein